MSTIGYYICVPFAWLVRLFYNLTGSYGVALILFTLVIKLILLPFQMKSKKSMLRMNRLSGQMKDIQKRYANNQMKMNEEMQKLYAEEGINPMSGCLWSFIPLPILIALYSIIRQPITHFMMLSKDALEGLIQTATTAGVNMSNIVMMKDGVAAVGKDGFTQLASYGQINLVKAVQELGLATPDGWFNVNYKFIGLDLTATPWEYIKDFSFTWAVIGVVLIPILAGLSQFILSKITMKSQPQADATAASMKSMMYMMPLMSVYIAFIMPAALGVYWIAQSVFSLIQEVVLNKTLNAKLEAEEEARFQARQADRQKRMEEARVLEQQRKQEEQKKKTLREKQQAAQAAKAAKAAKAATSTTEAGRVGDRPYARGRAYKADRYDETKYGAVMRQFIDVTGKTEDEAISRALEQLKLDRDDVSVEILERAKAGFLGLGSCPAKVRVSYGEDDAPAPEQPKVMEKVREDKPKAEKPKADKPRTEKKPAEKSQRREEPVKKEAPKTEEVPFVPVDLGEEVNDDRAQEIKKFLSGLLQQMEVTAEVKVYLPEKGRYKVILEGQGLGAIIGRRGETLDAIQQLTSYSVNRTGSRVRVQLDAENYRAKREQSLERLANKVAAKVVKYRRSVTLEPMNAYERHVIHTALQEVPGVTTYSTGVDPNRRVIVAFDREKK